MRKKTYRKFCCALVLHFLLILPSITESAEIVGNLRKWHTIEIHFQGPNAKELDNQPNPFLDYRMQVLFTSTNGKEYNVPGFFNGNGKGEGNGNVWTVRFTPDEAGYWTYKASFRRRKNIAVDLRPFAGEAANFDSESGSFEVKDRNPDAPGFLKWGRLDYVGGHYLKFVDGPYWIKGGSDSPEDLLAYVDFDNTVPSHRYPNHLRDWNEGDPTWKGGKGKAIIGLLNYFSCQHVNSIYFLTMNIGGDGKNVWPFAGKINPEGDPSNDNTHYDISKLHQWEVVFAHAQRKGIFLHFVLNEAEEKNKLELDEATLREERKLYYRELIARFGHHNALQWNISEEFDLFLDLGPDRVKEFAHYIRDVDPYDHPIVVHNKGRDPDPNWLPFLGDSRISSTSLQFYESTAKWGERVEKWRRLTEIAGRPLPINLDEFLMLSPENQDQLRKEVLWSTYLSGGNVEFILKGYLRNEGFRTVEKMWQWTWYARRFMQEHLPFTEMEPDDLALIGGSTDLGGPQVFAKYGEVYAIYFPIANPTGKLTMWRVKGTLEQRWYNPRTGKFEGEVRRIKAESTVTIGPPPNDPHEDWVVLVRKIANPD